ncbi:3-methyl-2-oxobutanoate hydroxymethyltransferase [secondary endosymbiont of Ctenarytaina eucalypti]|uniref:3-methyl-2-oxobutanoate hydroxymethyltransferase n=1 Tax=secondary endosymbiont of Ctenarytaina eucalypti TaxID=1199245 RepID=J3TX50_9ENTR|nr:3-methyl-2-oxobutanoate hydroxymethyltransferase [secondary endosymbiont of Ctenarytaina eucalypti]AFP84685.1 3-methyl-2-oxobutanoate hydroxymethyltransferase [secondary endosymbiont of Ctenarytaina eucalypti]
MTTIAHLRNWKQQQRKFASMTAYDAAFSRLFAEQGVEIMLVGDSLGMTMQGHVSTLPVTVADIVYHTHCVRRGAPSCFLLADLPFMSYATSFQAYENAAALMRAGANMVKLEGGAWLTDIVSSLTERAVPVCGHLGLTPQSVNIFGGYKVQGRDPAGAEQLLADALSLEQAGAQLLVLECVLVGLAERVTQALTIPVIGIGSGPVTDGQILVMQDALGITGDSAPSFSSNFLSAGGDIATAVRRYVQEVESGHFPAAEHSFYS